MINQQSIGSFLRELRQAQGITQEALAGELGVSNRSVSRWETGRIRAAKMRLLHRTNA